MVCSVIFQGNPQREAEPQAVHQALFSGLNQKQESVSYARYWISFFHDA
jgi:hypothetical protein